MTEQNKIEQLAIEVLMQGLVKFLCFFTLPLYYTTLFCLHLMTCQNANIYVYIYVLYDDFLFRIY